MDEHTAQISMNIQDATAPKAGAAPHDTTAATAATAPSDTTAAEVPEDELTPLQRLEREHPETMVFHGTSFHTNMASLGKRDLVKLEPEPQAARPTRYQATEAPGPKKAAGTRYKRSSYSRREKKAKEIALAFKESADEFEINLLILYTYVASKAYERVLSGEYTPAKNSDRVCNVFFTVQQFMKDRGIEDDENGFNREHVKKELKKLLLLLFHMEVEYSEWDSELIEFASYSKRPIRSWTAKVSITPEFMYYVFGTRKRTVYLPRILFKADTQYYPSSFRLGYHIVNHSTMNAGKRNQFYMAVETLLKKLPEIPTVEDLRERDRINPKGRAYYKRTEKILRVMEKSFDHLVDLGFLSDWCYVGKDNREEELIFEGMKKGPDGKRYPEPRKARLDEVIDGEVAIRWTVQPKYAHALSIQTEETIKYKEAQAAAKAEKQAQK